MSTAEFKKYQFITLVQNSFLHRVLVLRTLEKPYDEHTKLGYVDGWMGDALRAADKMPTTLSTQEIIEAAFDFVEFHWQMDETETKPLSWFLAD